MFLGRGQQRKLACSCSSTTQAVDHRHQRLIHTKGAESPADPTVGSTPPCFAGRASAEGTFWALAYCQRHSYSVADQCLGEWKCTKRFAIVCRQDAEDSQSRDAGAVRRGKAPNPARHAAPFETIGDFKDHKPATASHVKVALLRREAHEDYGKSSRADFPSRL